MFAAAGDGRLSTVAGRRRAAQTAYLQLTVVAPKPTFTGRQDARARRRRVDHFGFSPGLFRDFPPPSDMAFSIASSTVPKISKRLSRCARLNDSSTRGFIAANLIRPP